MKKEKLKNIVNKNKPFSIGILAGIIFLSILIPIIIINETPETYYATHDIGLQGSTNPFNGNNKLTYDGMSIHFGWHYVGNDPSYTYGFLMRFNIQNKPEVWSKCEISLYMYQTVGNKGSALIYLFEGNWTEKEWDGYGPYMRDIEIYWRIEEPIGSVSNSVIGFEINDISEYINDITTNTFSIAVIPERTYNGVGWIYSSEWDGSDFPYILPKSDSYKNYLPQLVWS